MPKATSTPIYLEVGRKRVFAGALDWPGWCRSGRDEAAAIAALADYGPRYAKVLAETKLGFTAPEETDFTVVERLAGNATTDFGAIGVPPSRDADAFGEAERKRAETILEASWAAFDCALDSATGHVLQKGPRGGGRDVEKIIRHLLGGDAGYLRAFGQKFKQDDAAPVATELERTRTAIRQALAAAARGEIPTKGPRGGEIWTPRYYVRRVAWHTLDHAWEIEDRVE